MQPLIMVFVAVSMIALQFSRESYTLFSTSTVIDAREEQPEKQLLPMLVTDDGMLMAVREEQPLKQLLPMLVTDDGMLMDAREEQLLKEPSYRFVTELGIIVFIQPRIKVLVAVSMTALQLFLESYIVLSLSTTIALIAEHP